MMRTRILIGAGLLLAGCQTPRHQAVAATPSAGTTYQADGRTVRITGLTALPARGAMAFDGAGATVPPQFQYLYGSAEAAALSRQAFAVLATFATDPARRQSVVLTADATLAVPRWADCGAKPKAAMFDADETILLNLGIEEHAARHPAPFDAAEWDRWEKTGAAAVAAVPGAVDAFAALRRAGVTIIVNSNRSAANAAGTVAALRTAGLGSFEPGRTLFLRDGPSGKDPRRATIAARYCVVAMGGDQLGDFTDLFAAIGSPADRRRAANSAPIAQLWGAGWFVLPNPVYGSALKGGFDEVFPAGKRWNDPGNR